MQAVDKIFTDTTPSLIPRIAAALPQEADISTRSSVAKNYISKFLAQASTSTTELREQPDDANNEDEDDEEDTPGLVSVFQGLSRQTMVLNLVSGSIHFSFTLPALSCSCRSMLSPCDLVLIDCAGTFPLRCSRGHY
jgi:hypothetical protein